MKTIQTFRVQIFMAGDIETAKRYLRRHCYDVGLCVTVMPSTFIYTGGEEAGRKTAIDKKRAQGFLALWTI